MLSQILAQLVQIALALLTKMKELLSAVKWEVPYSAPARPLATTLFLLPLTAVPTLTVNLTRTLVRALLSAAQSMAPCCAQNLLHALKLLRPTLL